MASTTPRPTGWQSETPAAGNGWAPPLQIRVAPARRERKPALVVLGLVLVLVCGTVTAALYLRVGGRVAVLTVARPVAAGHRVTDGDLTTARISYDPALHALPADLRDRVVGRVAAVTLVPGTLLTREELTTSSVPGPGEAVVGVALKPGQLPAEGLHEGDTVMVVRTPSANEAPGQSGSQVAKGPDVLVPSAQVFGSRQSDNGDSTVVSVVVDKTDAVAVTTAQATGQVSLVLLVAGSGS